MQKSYQRFIRCASFASASPVDIDLLLFKLELHPYLYKRPYTELLELHKKHGILTAGFGPIRAHHKHPDGPLSQPLAEIAKRLSAAHGKAVNDIQVLLKWMESQEIIPVMYGFSCSASFE